MTGFIISSLIGALCIVLGISNMRGNITSLHSYHRHRVSEEDRLPFGRRVGLGTIIVGAGIILFSAMGCISLYTKNDTLTLIGTAILFIGIIIGMILVFGAMKKYNGGIF